MRSMLEDEITILIGACLVNRDMKRHHRGEPQDSCYGAWEMWQKLFKFPCSFVGGNKSQRYQTSIKSCLHQLIAIDFGVKSLNFYETVSHM